MPIQDAILTTSRLHIFSKKYTHKLMYTRMIFDEINVSD